MPGPSCIPVPSSVRSVAGTSVPRAFLGGEGVLGTAPPVPPLQPSGPYVVLPLGTVPTTTSTLLFQSKALTEDPPRGRRRGFARVESKILRDLGLGYRYGACPPVPGGNTQTASLLASLRVGSSNLPSFTPDAWYFH